MASSFGRLVQVDYETRRVVATLELHGAAPLTCVAATEGFVATGDAAGLLRLWPLDFGAFLLQAQHDAGVASLAVSPSDLRIAVSTASGTLGVLDVATHAYITAVRPHRTGVAALAFSTHHGPGQGPGQGPGRELLAATAGVDRTIRVFNLETGAQTFEFTAEADPPTALAFHPGSGEGGGRGIVACGFRSGAVRVLAVGSPAPLQEHHPHPSGAHVAQVRWQRCASTLHCFSFPRRCSPIGCALPLRCSFRPMAAASTR